MSLIGCLHFFLACFILHSYHPKRKRGQLMCLKLSINLEFPREWETRYIEIHSCFFCVWLEIHSCLSIGAPNFHILIPRIDNISTIRDSWVRCPQLAHSSLSMYWAYIWIRILTSWAINMNFACRQCGLSSWNSSIVFVSHDDPKHLLWAPIKSWDNCIAALVLKCNCTFALVFLTLHVCPWFLKLKALFAPVCQHRELDLNNCSKKISQKRKKEKRLYYPLSQTHYSVHRFAPCSPRRPAAPPCTFMGEINFYLDLSKLQ